MQVLGYVLGAIFLCGLIALITINIIGIVHDVKNKKSNKKGE